MCSLIRTGRSLQVSVMYEPIDYRTYLLNAKEKRILMIGLAGTSLVLAVLFFDLLPLYLLTLSGNDILMTIGLSHHRYTLLYFFLNMLSISETCYTLVFIPCIDHHPEL